MGSNTIFFVIIAILIAAIYLINNNVSFIGRGKKLIITALIAMMDLSIIYINAHIFIIIKADSFAQAATIVILSAIITVVVIVLSIIRWLKIIAERKMEVTTLINCRIYNRTFYYKLQGMSVQGKKNSFLLLCKDGKDFINAMNNGIYSFNIRYFTSSKRIESVTLMTEQAVYENMNNIVNNSMKNQEIKGKKWWKQK